MENYVSTSDARKQLGCSGQTIRNLIKAGKLEAVQLGNGRFLINELSLQKYQQDGTKGTEIAKNANPKAKILHNTRPKAVENPSNQLVKEIREQHGSRPEWLNLYQALLETQINLDDIVLECIFRTPKGCFKQFNTASAYSVPDNAFKFEEELFINWYDYDLESEAAKYYLVTDFRWWLQLTYRGKIVMRSKDERPPASDLGLRAWIGDQEEAIKDEREMLRAQNKRRGQEVIGALVLCGGTAALGLMIGLASKSKTPYLGPGPSTP